MAFAQALAEFFLLCLLGTLFQLDPGPKPVLLENLLNDHSKYRNLSRASPLLFSRLEFRVSVGEVLQNTMVLFALLEDLMRVSPDLVAHFIFSQLRKTVLGLRQDEKRGSEVALERKNQRFFFALSVPPFGPAFGGEVRLFDEEALQMNIEVLHINNLVPLTEIVRV